jgi:hypothetical protein
MKNSINDVNTNLNNALNESLDSVKNLQHDIATIHGQIKFITAPIEWANQALSKLYLGLFLDVVLALVY